MKRAYDRSAARELDAMGAAADDDDDAATADAGRGDARTRGAEFAMILRRSARVTAYGENFAMARSSSERSLGAVDDDDGLCCGSGKKVGVEDCASAMEDCASAVEDCMAVGRFVCIADGLF